MDWDLTIKLLIAVAPVMALLFVFDRLDVFNLISLRAIVLLVLAGAAIAGLSFLANWRVMDGFPIGFTDYSKYVAPAVEEPMKALFIVLLFAFNRIGFKLDAAIAGFAVGAGFSVVENGWFLHALPEANIGAWLVRGFGTAIMHGGATALFAVISHELTERQSEGLASRYRFNPLLFIPGLVVAIVVHSAFNHFPNQPMLAMALTLLLVPITLFLVFSRNEKAVGRWLQADHDAHRKALDDIRSGRFADSEQGRAIAALAGRFKGRAADVFAWIELQTELVLRAEELMLANQAGQPAEIGPEERDKTARLDELERRLGGPVRAAVRPRLGFSRNDLWELRLLRERARKA